MAIKMRKAVEVLDFNLKEAGKRMPPDVKDSIQLAIALMRAVLYVRSGGSFDVHALLPGEMPED